MASLKDYVSEGLRKGYTKKELTSLLLDKGYSQKEIDSLFQEPVKTKKRESTAEIGFFERIGVLISSPNRFFENVRDTHIGNSIGLYALAAVVGVALSFVLSIMMRNSLFMGQYIGFGGLLGVGVFSVIFTFIFSFIVAGLLHGCVKIFSGNGNYVDTYNALMYSLLPSIILSFIPLIGALAGIYALVLLVIGISKYHEVSIGKSIGAVVIAGLAVAVILVALVFIFISIAFRGW